MKSVTLKITDSTVTLGNPLAIPGYNKSANCTIERIDNVPDDISSGDVLRQALKVVIWPRRDCYSWSDIAGKSAGQTIRLA